MSVCVCVCLCVCVCACVWVVVLLNVSSGLFCLRANQHLLAAGVVSMSAGQLHGAVAARPARSPVSGEAFVKICNGRHWSTCYLRRATSTALKGPRRSKSPLAPPDSIFTPCNADSCLISLCSGHACPLGLLRQLPAHTTHPPLTAAPVPGHDSTLTYFTSTAHAAFKQPSCRPEIGHLLMPTSTQKTPVELLPSLRIGVKQRGGYGRGEGGERQQQPLTELYWDNNNNKWAGGQVQ